MGMLPMNAPAKLTADTPVLLRERDGDVAILVLNRPEARNSLSEAMLVALSDSLSEIAADKTVRAVVLAANGPGFCAGHDLKELTGRRSDADGGRAYFRQGHDLVQRNDAADRQSASADDCRRARRGDRRRLLSWWRAAIWRLHPPTPHLPRLVSTSVCSVRRQWSHSPATLHASMPWRCC